MAPLFLGALWVVSAGSLPKPAELTGKVTSPSSALLKWTPAVGNVSARYEIYRTFDPPNNSKWLVLGWTKTLNWESVGMLGGSTYTHRVCVEYSPLQCTDNLSVTTAPWVPSPVGRLLQVANVSFPRIGEGTIVRRGDELLCFLSRQSQNADVGNSNITLQRSSDNGLTWSAPVQIAPSTDAPSRANPGAALIPSGAIVLTYFVGVSHAQAMRVWRTSSDGGATWSDEAPLTDGSHPYMTGAHDRLRLLSNGRLIEPVHYKDTVARPTELHTLVYASDDEGKTWHPHGLRNGSGLGVPLSASKLPHADVSGCNEFGFYETALTEVSPSNKDGRLLMVGRTCSGWLYSSVSTDFGDTWSEPLPVGGAERVREGGIRHPLAPPNVATLTANGTEVLVLVTEPHFTGIPWTLGSRVVLALQVSRDGGATWAQYRQLESTDASAEYSYCSVFPDDQTQSLHIVYRSGRANLVSPRYQRIPYEEIIGTTPN
eukprot:m.130991 g.130991  ORF g.130991 m.130991 type:complete len:486 (-) comp13740_c0_seq2:87-1544(-)